MKNFFSRYFDDLLLVAGCACILYGLSQWNAIVTWIVAGIMLIVFGVMVAKDMAKNAAEKPGNTQSPED